MSAELAALQCGLGDIAFKVLKECGHMQPRPPLDVVLAIGSQMRSHLYLKVSTGNGITQDAC